jgi:hypothetical protein
MDHVVMMEEDFSAVKEMMFACWWLQSSFREQWRSPLFSSVWEKICNRGIKAESYEQSWGHKGVFAPLSPVLCEAYAAISCHWWLLAGTSALVNLLILLATRIAEFYTHVWRPWKLVVWLWLAQKSCILFPAIVDSLMSRESVWCW